MLPKQGPSQWNGDRWHLMGIPPHCKAPPPRNFPTKQNFLAIPFVKVFTRTMIKVIWLHDTQSEQIGCMHALRLAIERSFQAAPRGGLIIQRPRYSRLDLWNIWGLWWSGTYSIHNYVLCIPPSTTCCSHSTLYTACWQTNQAWGYSRLAS